MSDNLQTTTTKMKKVQITKHRKTNTKSAFLILHCCKCDVEMKTENKTNKKDDVV